ncbi:helix-turn-helix domain-containing protein [Arthrobacter sp. ZGTC412]|uniref:helix-turn-helix domain-containing protein n=1 Tax=Arthrobacter sp. ZGTC412 TaxID=2058900 RepID=UPI000CE2FFF1|nr:helix-turn-helix transcriptional regulator [Arthrobacter sp. ZGTC412]
MPAGAGEPAGQHAKAFSEAIRLHMEQQGVSGKSLAAMIGLSQNYVATWLRDGRAFTVNDVESIAAALGFRSST